MTENDEEVLKSEIDEIMNRVKTIMENVAKVMPQEKEGEAPPAIPPDP